MAESAALTRDVLLGGQLLLWQQERGHRAGTDAMLLVAASGHCEHVVDLGCGIGTIGLAVLVLGRAARATLVERDAEFAALARQNVALNGLEARACVAEVDIGARSAALTEAGLAPGVADLVLTNPPFNTPGQHRASPNERRAAAHAMLPESFETWTQTAARALKPGGRFVVIHRPEALVWLLPMLAKRFAALSILPVHARAGEPAKRVLISGHLSSKAPARMLPALVLHHDDGSFTDAATAIHTGEAKLMVS